MSAVEKVENPVVVLRHQLDSMEGQFKAALPAHIPAERFARVLMTAVQQNPELLEVERRSFWNAAMRAAQDGLLPDGREGAMVVRKDRNRGKLANWQPMIAGVRKKARNSGEITSWDAHVVHFGDHFQFQLGDAPQINHTYDLRSDRGSIIGAYSVCVLKDGTKSYEVMSIGEIHAIRDRSDAWKAFKAGLIKSTPWSTDEGEMCRKTVARRHSKVLPMSTDLDDLIRRDDDLYDLPGARDEANQRLHGGKPQNLAGRLDALASIPRRPIEHESDAAQSEETDQPDQKEGATAVAPQEAAATAQDGQKADEATELETAAGDPDAPAGGPSQPEAEGRRAKADARGAEAQRKGMAREAMPGEYRSNDRTEERLAWLDGFDRAATEAKGGEPSA